MDGNVKGKRSIRTSIDLRGKSDDEIAAMELPEGRTCDSTRCVQIRTDSYFLRSYSGKRVEWCEVVSIIPDGPYHGDEKIPTSVEVTP